MDKLKRNTWLVRVVALAIFLLGFAAGALAPLAYRAWSERGTRFDSMVKELKLTPEQQTQMKQIFGDTRTQLQALRKESEPRVAEIRRQADERMRQVLTPEQWEQFQKSRDEGRRRGRGGRVDGSRSPDER